MQDELALLSRARAFDQEALGQIHDLYYDAIFRYVSFRVGNVQTVEDLTSEVFTRFLSSLSERNAPQNTIQGWLFGTASRVVKEYYRRASRAQLAPLNDTIAAKGINIDDKLQADLEKELLRKAVTELTDDQQHVLAMRFGYGMAIRDVAKTMNKSEAAIKMLQARAIASLGRKLSGMEVGQ